MRSSTFRIAAICLCLVTLGASLSFAQRAGGPPQWTNDAVMLRALEKTADAIQASFDKNGLKDVLGLPALMKEAGIAYDPSLPATTDLRVVRGKTWPQMQQLRGIYSMDILYALAFGKRLDSLITVMASVDETLDERSTRLWQKRQNTSDIYALADIGVRYFTKVVKELKTDFTKGGVFVPVLFGIGLETFYLYAKTGLATGITNDYSAFLQKNIPLLQILKDIYDATDLMPVDKYPSRLIATFDDNSAIVEALLGIMQKSKGKPTEADLRAIIAIVDKPRAELLALAK